MHHLLDVLKSIMEVHREKFVGSPGTYKMLMWFVISMNWIRWSFVSPYGCSIWTRNRPDMAEFSVVWRMWEINSSTQEGQVNKLPRIPERRVASVSGWEEPGQPMLRVSSYLIKDFKCQCFSPLKKYRDEVDLGLPCLKNWDRWSR